MASRGASVQDIKQRTGLSGSSARVVSNNYNPSRTSAPKAAPSRSSSSSSSSRGGSSSSSNRNSGGSGSSSRSKAQTLASSGASAKQIAKRTGVSRSSAKKIVGRATNQAAAQQAARVEAATQARQAMDPTIADAIQSQADQGLSIGQQFYDSPEFQNVLGTSGLTPQQVAEYAMTQGYSLGDQFQDQFGSTIGERLNMKDAKNLAQALRIAGARGKGNMVNRKELKKMTRMFDKTGLNILGRMDKLNENTAKKGMSPLGIKSNVYNQIFRGKFGDTSYRPMGKYDGPLAQNLFAMYDTVNPRMKDQAQTTTRGTGKMPKGFGVYGRYNDQPIFSEGVGKSWADTKFGQPKTTTYEPFYAPPEDVGGGTVGDIGEIPLPPEEELPPDANQSGFGADLSSFATGWRGAKGRRARAGRGAQGFGSMMIAPGNAAGVGTNFG